ncbi:hypothetical protein AAG906_003160 [Vitis piasezkii]
MENRGHSSDPNPLDTFVLVLQDRHRSHLVNSGQEMDPRLRPYIIQSGFYGVYRIGHITLDWGLITSLVEKWRLETHISLTCWGDDHYFIGWVTPPTSEIKGLAISTRWLCHQFSHPPTHDQVLWEPYMGDLVAYLSTISLIDQEIWWTMSPLICFDIVKWHQPNRGAFHAQYITSWASRAERIATAPPMVGAIDQMRYHSIATTTHQSVGPTSGALGDIHQIPIDILHSPTSSYPSMRPPVSATIVRMQPI